MDRLNDFLLTIGNEPVKKVEDIKIYNVMKYLKKYNESKENKFLAFTKIQNEFAKDKVKSMLEDEIKESIPDNEDIDYYYKVSNGEGRRYYN